MKILRRSVVAMVMIFGAGLALAESAPGASEKNLAAIREFEVDYLKAVNDGDVSAQLAMVSRKSNVYSILDGKIWRGWDAVKSQAEAYVPVSKVVQFIVDELEIVPTGPDTAIVVIRGHGMKVNPTDTSFPDMAGVLSHVLERTPEGWRMLHEHYSSTLTPEFLEWQLALLRYQKEAQAGSSPASKP